MGNINQGRYDRLLRRTTAQVGPGSKVGNALEDLFPTLDVENVPGELLRASGWILGCGRTDRTSAIGTTNVQQLRNPPGSGQLITLTSVYISSNSNTAITWGPSFTALTDASVPGAQRDTRDGSIEPTVALLERQDAGVASAFGIAIVSANTPLHLFDPNGLAVLAPGGAFRLATAGTNIRLAVGWMWRERVAEPEELDF